MERSAYVMKKIDVMNVVKIGVAVASVGIAVAQNYFDKKDLDAKVAEKVSEALQNKAGES